MVRTAGASATLMSRDEGYAQVRFASGEIRRINENCYATIGQVATRNTKMSFSAKPVASSSRHPSVEPRRLPKTPVDHPMGGGAGKTSGGGHPVTPWVFITKARKP